MHDADDATLMQALREADPLKQHTLDADTRLRLERSWSQARDVSLAGTWTERQAAARHGRLLQLAAVVMAAMVVLAAGGTLWAVIGQRSAATTQPAPAAVEGSFRATVRWIGEPSLPDVLTFDVVDGRMHVRTDTPERDGVPEPWGVWPGFGDATPVFIDEQITSGDEIYLRARAGEHGSVRWYRYTGPRLKLPVWGRPPVGEDLTLPVFTEGTRGFRRVDDADAEARGLTRYSARESGADVDFLGWFGDMHGEPGSPSAPPMDIWVDGSGRVRRVLDRPADALPVDIRFDQFDGLNPIAVPPGEGDEVPVATDTLGMSLVGCGDPARSDALREAVRADLAGNDDVASYEFFDWSTGEADRIAPDVQDDVTDELFVAVARYNDDVDIDAMHEREGQRLPELGDQLTPDAYVCSYETLDWIELEG
jgi:hypothetical protein